ncbi:GIY-YIG nuclease family protein [Tenacibaculum sp. A30]|uniref:GIY-YIG nuclease family protein n=1 Tax=Tenacibaculum sp. A30 TaxID=3442644 RepID=UPI003EBE4B4F
MHFLYILHSQTINRYYVGESINPENRLLQHNTHHYKSNYTKATSYWKIILTHSCQNKQDALYLERFIKRMKSKKFIEKIIANPSILNDILLRK